MGRRGPERSKGTLVEMMQVEPIILKQLAVDCNISQGELAIHLGTSRPTVNLTINRGYIPQSVADYKAKVETYLINQPDVELWLAQNGYRLADIWSPLGKLCFRAHPKSTWQKNKAMV